MLLLIPETALHTCSKARKLLVSVRESTSVSRLPISGKAELPLPQKLIVLAVDQWRMEPSASCSSDMYASSRIRFGLCVVRSNSSRAAKTRS